MTRGKLSTPPGHVNLRMLAEHLELSQTTVSLVLNNSPSAHSRVENVTNIVLDHHAAVQQALQHLYELGHRKIAFMRGPEAIPDSEFRWEAIQLVARDLGLRIDPTYVVHIDASGWSMKTG